MERMPGIFIIFVVLSCLSAACQAQSADQILNRNIRAVGGTKVLAGIKSFIVEGQLYRPQDGKTGLYTEIARAPNEFFQEIEVGQEVHREGYNGKSAWRQDPFGALATLTGDEAVLTEAIAKSRNARSLNYGKDHSRGQLAGQESIRGQQVFRVEFTDGSHCKRTLFFDTQTYMILQEKIEAGGNSTEIDYDGYHAVDGIMEPSTMELRHRDETWLVSNIHVVHNRQLESDVFDFPSSSSESLPDITQLLKEVQDNQRAVDNILESYAYTKVEEEGNVDDQGNTKNRRTREYAVFYVKGREIQKLVGKDGKPLSPVEHTKEEERVKRLILQYDSAGAKPNDERRKDAQDEDQLHISTFLRAGRFARPRRERLRGHEMIVFDIEPNPGYRPKNMNEKLIQRLGGVMWVDDKTHQVVRLQAVLDTDAKIGGGLLGSMQKGSSAVFDQDLVNNEVWLPSLVEEHVSGHYLLFKGFKEDLVIHYSKYQKFRIDVSQR